MIRILALVAALTLTAYAPRHVPLMDRQPDGTVTRPNWP